MIRFGAWFLAVVMVSAGCSTEDPLAEYTRTVGDITSEMRRASVAALPSNEITREGITGVNDARAAAVQALEDTDVPHELAPEHTALLVTLSDLATAGLELVESTADLDRRDFEAAVLAATDLDELVRRVAAACGAFEQRAAELGHTTDLAC